MMGKLRFFLIMTLIGVCGANAQDFSFGPKVGGNYFTHTGEDEYDFKYKAGFHVGFFVGYRANEWFGLQGELIYSRQGARQEINIVSLDFQNDPSAAEDKSKINFNFDYITLPILAKFYPTEGFHLFMGPQVGLLISAKEKSVETNIPELKDYEADIKRFFRDADFGMLVGTGYDFDKGLTLQARCYFGLVNINKIRVELADGSKQNPKLKNQGFQLSLGYRF